MDPFVVLRLSVPKKVKFAAELQVKPYYFLVKR